MEIKGRNEGGERGILMLSFWESLGEKAAKKDFLLEILKGYNSWGPCTRFGLGGPKGYLWSWVVGETSPVGRVAKLVWAG